MSLDDVAVHPVGRQAQILRDLIDNPACSTARLFDQLYHDDPEGGPDVGRRIIRKHIWHLRRHLRPGWRIVPVDHAGRPAPCAGGAVAWKLERLCA